MANINLLPEQMREQERKEVRRVAKKPKIFSVELSRAQKAKKEAPIKPPRKSLWQKMFGGSKGGELASGTPLVVRSGTKVDLLGNARKQKNEYHQTPPVPKAKPKRKKSFLRSIGRPKSPIKPIEPNKYVPPQAFDSGKKRKRPVKMDIKYADMGQKKKSGGFLARLKNIFKPNKNKIRRERLEREKEAKIKQDRMIKEQMKRAELEKKARIEEEEKAKKKEAGIKKAKGKYHVGPKPYRSGLNINLVPEELAFRRYSKGSQQIVGILMAIIIPAVIIGGLYFVIDQQQKAMQRNVALLNENKSELISYINGFKNLQEKNIRIQDKLLAINGLLDNHIYWTKFFSLLERYTLDEVHYSEFTADTSGEFMLPAIVTIAGGSTVEEQVAEGYSKAAAQMVALKQASDFVKQIKVDNLELVSSDDAGIKGVKLEINIELIGGVFQEENNN